MCLEHTLVMLFMLDGSLTWAAHPKHREVWAGPSWSCTAVSYDVAFVWSLVRFITKAIHPFTSAAAAGAQIVACFCWAAAECMMQHTVLRHAVSDALSHTSVTVGGASCACVSQRDSMGSHNEGGRMGDCCLLFLLCMSRFPITLPTLHTSGPAWPLRQSLWYTLFFLLVNLTACARLRSLK
jgi:hypothetical protein